MGGSPERGEKKRKRGKKSQHIKKGVKENSNDVGSTRSGFKNASAQAKPCPPKKKTKNPPQKEAIKSKQKKKKNVQGGERVKKKTAHRGGRSDYW